MDLYNYFRSSASFRTRIALNYKQLSYTKIDIDLPNNEHNTSNYLKVNPAGLVPTLVDNEHFIYQSLAIIEYLDEKYPEQPILPKDILARAYVRTLAFTVACDIHPLNNLSVLQYLTKDFNHSEDDKLRWYSHWIHRGLSALEHSITSQKFYNGKYCYKDSFSIADICLIPQLYNAKRYKCDLGNYPTLLAIEAECLKLDAVKTAYPEG